VGDSRYDDETAYDREQAARKDARDRIYAYLEAGGSVSGLDPDLIAASGLTDAELAAFDMYYGSSGGSGRGGSSGIKGGKKYQVWTRIFDDDSYIIDTDTTRKAIVDDYVSGELTDAEYHDLMGRIPG